VRVRYLPRAFADLEAIYSYVANRNPQAALGIIAAIRNSVVVLSAFPEVGQPADDSGVRVLHSSHHIYKIYYSIADDEIQILHIRHAARRPPGAGEL
jgi:plasmid stabilization system protein ParE